MYTLFVIAVVLLSVTVIVIFLMVIGATMLVAFAVWQEHRLKSLSGRAPGLVARLARMLLGVYAPREADEIFPRPRSRAGGRRNRRPESGERDEEPEDGQPRGWSG